MTNPDEQAWELSIARCDDGDILLSQGLDGCGDEMVVRLHRCHIDLLAHVTGYVHADEVARACERLQDRLNMLTALVECHTKPGDPLRAAAAVIVGTQPNQLQETTKLVDDGDALAHPRRDLCDSGSSAAPDQLDLLGNDMFSQPQHHPTIKENHQ